MKNASKFKFVKGKELGFSLVSTIVALGITGIIISAMASLFTFQHREMRGLKQKMASVNLNQYVLRAFQNPKNCSCHLDPTKNPTSLSPLTINTTTSVPQAINLGTLRNGCDFGITTNIIAEVDGIVPNSAGLTVKSVGIRNILPTGSANEYQGTLILDYHQESVGTALNPVSLDLVFTVDPTSGTPAARPIDLCAGGGSLDLSTCKDFKAPYTFADSQISCPLTHPNPLRGGCDSVCAWIRTNQLVGNTQHCIVVVDPGGHHCYHAGQDDVAAHITCCQ